jgi:hypothetical protein
MKNTVDCTTALSATILLTRYARFCWRHFGSCIYAGQLHTIIVPKRDAGAAAMTTAAARHGGHRSIPRLWLLVLHLAGPAGALGHALCKRLSVGSRAVLVCFEPFHAVDVRKITYRTHTQTLWSVASFARESVTAKRMVGERTVSRLRQQLRTQCGSDVEHPQHAAHPRHADAARLHEIRRAEGAQLGDGGARGVPRGPQRSGEQLGRGHPSGDL